MENKLLVYKASAGSGKTYTLARNYLEMLFRGSSSANAHRRIMAVTFTNKATDEMKRRILMELAFLADGRESAHLNHLCSVLRRSEEELRSEARRLLKALLEDYSAFNVSTIDKFFLSVVRAFTHEMKLNSSYAIQLSVLELLPEVVDMLFDGLDSDKELRRLIAHFIDDKLDSGSDWNVRRDILKFAEKNCDVQASVGDVDLEHIKGILINKKRGLGEAFAFVSEVKNDPVYAERVSRWQSKIDNLEKLQQGELEIPDPVLNFIANPDKNIKKGTSDADTQHIYELCSRIREAIDSPQRRDAITASVMLKQFYLFSLLSYLQANIAAIAQRQNLLLLSRAEGFLTEIIKNSDTPFIYEKIGTKILHFMIDEFQDTSKQQWNNFLPLISNSLGEGNTNLVVGDVKQSIYRFRNADCDLLNTQLAQEPSIMHYIRNEHLVYNWRSYGNVIEFNNRFFSFARDYFVDLFDTKAKEQEQHRMLYNEVKEKFSSAYGDIEQKLGQKSKQGGYVSLVSFAKENKEWEQCALDLMTAQIRALKERGVRLSDIAVLTRVNKEAVVVAEQLIANGIEVMSNEAVRVSNARSVQLLEALLTLKVEPNKVNRFQALYLYYELLEGAEQAFANAMQAYKQTESDVLAFVKRSAATIFEQVEQYIAYLQLPTHCANEVAYIQAFQDAVFKYEHSKGSDLAGFLAYWGDQDVKLSVSGNVDAVNILTIHKSKGLEYPYVFMPLLDLSFEPSSNAVLWFDTKDAGQPFCQMPIVPVNYSKILLESHFAPQYLREKFASYLDGLNTLYVAFTRAGKELYMSFATKSDEAVVEKSPEKQLIASFLKSGRLDLRSKECTMDDGSNYVHYEFGAPVEVEAVAENTVAQEYTMPATYFVSTHDRCVYTLAQTSPAAEKSCKADSQQLGLLLHSLLASVQTLSDIPAVAAKFVGDGLLSQEDADAAVEKLQQFFVKHGGEHWFSDEYEVMNEQEIVYNKQVLRPDRIMIKGSTAIVVDYKFGQHQSDNYLEQVRNYQRAIASMGYTTEGYLCYVELDEVVEVPI